MSYQFYRHDAQHFLWSTFQFLLSLVHRFLRSGQLPDEKIPECCKEYLQNKIHRKPSTGCMDRLSNQHLVVCIAWFEFYQRKIPTIWLKFTWMPTTSFIENCISNTIDPEDPSNRFICSKWTVRKKKCCKDIHKNIKKYFQDMNFEFEMYVAIDTLNWLFKKQVKSISTFALWSSAGCI